MSLTGWLILFLIIQVIHFLGTWKLYVKAGRQSWEAAIPVYNAIILMGIINRPKWWVVLLFIPIVNLLMFPIIWIETCRSFGFNSTKDTLLAVFTLGLYIFYINYATDATHIENRSLKPKTGFGEWVSSIAFAIIAATLVHTYFIQPYTIPTSSLEKTLLIGDYLFVSKFHYGARVPITTVSAPMVHDSIPGLGIKSYLSDSKEETYRNSLKNKLSLPYMRLPGLQKIKRNDIVVFSWPADSTNYMWGDNSGKFTYKPIDKKTNYVKRCVGVAGDTLEVRNGYVFINGKRTILPESAKPQWMHFVDTNGKRFTQGALNRYNIREGQLLNDGRYLLNLTDEEASLIAKNPIVKSVEKYIKPSGEYDSQVFPHNPKYPWSVDNFGPIFIPKKGATVELNANSILFYEQIIRRYENNDLTIFNDDIYINGKKTNTYTFKQDYFWMMGDNRQNSLDARAWGYVPFDHVVGKPIMVWFSWDAQTRSIRWDRMFTTVSNGKSKSYFWIAIVVIAGILFSIFKPKKKKA
ncbi:signal peptidase I [Tenacibaculum adriaticum]|uniref:Signal peptidase I n=1 Tax=Tenacibaculum adriaticum TaxID=413713 RepID=A0A5S5DKQ1_9FLAO|nr:signal peptidase I [Tenacibaculum adriaticum]TYP96501.1 signal peptidase I [Tenacibaculum adriaticum]